MTKIPPKRFDPNKFPVADRLRELTFDKPVEIPIKYWSSIGAVAQSIGIKVATRTLGGKKNVTVYRVE